jgi:hypothetical protein
LIWQNLKRTTVALNEAQEENRALRQEIKELRGGERHSDSEPEAADRKPDDVGGEPEFESDARSDSSSEADVPATRP